MARDSSSVGAHLGSNERPIVELDGVVSGYTRWSGLGGAIGVVGALTVPRVLNLGFWIGALSIIVVITGVFMVVYYFAGRRLASLSRPPTETPYILVVLTDRRVLVLDRGLGSEDLKLAEDVPVRRISAVHHSRGGLLAPQQLGYSVEGDGERRYEFPRSQPVGRFVDSLR
ncbi:MAG: hypothetical protein QNJ75_04415 [Acidimicrobiia bacterium]|nr:hypothetical protein [Acidimicrobiia bacterium]